MNFRRYLLAAIVCVFVADLRAQSHTTGDFHGCAPTGDATATSASDPDLNARKNRDLPPASYVTKSVTAIVGDVPVAKAAGKKRRDKWSQAQRDSIASKEDSGIRVVGYFAGVKQEGPESCNCHDPNRVDYHVWLVAAPGQKKSKSIVVELSPRLLEAHPKWPGLATQAWSNGTQVWVSGWLTWDQEHPEQLKDRTTSSGTVIHATRATLWEIHPIHVIEVKKNGAWVAIDQ